MKIEAAKRPGVTVHDPPLATLSRFARAVQLSPLQLCETYPYVTRLLHALATPPKRRSVQARGARFSSQDTVRA